MSELSAHPVRTSAPDFESARCYLKILGVPMSFQGDFMFMVTKVLVTRKKYAFSHFIRKSTVGLP
jgi:hypothetical protein